MAEASRRASRPVVKGGLPNALFVASGVGALPAALDGTAHLVTVNFPWGSLLAGILGLDERVADAIARLPRPGGLIVVHLSVTERDGIAGVPGLDEAAIDGLAELQAGRGLVLTGGRPADDGELRGTHSSWARRLLGGESARPVWRLELRRTR